jgi:predicted O-methyltransferase YrrM
MVRVKKTIDQKKSWGVGFDGRKPVRYDVIPEIVREINAKVILEIGVYRGIRAAKMIQAALETLGKVSYYGFDLFEDFTDEVAEYEASPKPPTMREVYHRIKGIGVDVQLFKGRSQDTLPLLKSVSPDFVYIDGGHSFESVRADWENTKKIIHDDTVVVFDDYLEHSNWLKWGCNRTIDNLGPDYEYELLEPHDRYSLKQCGNLERRESDSWLVKVVKKK